MFEISVLKEMKLIELQEIAKVAKVTRYKTLKKDDLIYQILDFQASNPEKIALNQETSLTNHVSNENITAKPKRARVNSNSKDKVEEKNNTSTNEEFKIQTELFAEPDEKKRPRIIPNKNTTSLEKNIEVSIDNVVIPVIDTITATAETQSNLNNKNKKEKISKKQTYFYSD